MNKNITGSFYLRRRRKNQNPKIAQLHRAGATLVTCAQRARVSYRMAGFWAVGARRCARLDRAFTRLTRVLAGGPRSKGRQNPARTKGL